MVATRGQSWMAAADANTVIYDRAFSVLIRAQNVQSRSRRDLHLSVSRPTACSMKRTPGRNRFFMTISLISPRFKIRPLPARGRGQRHVTSPHGSALIRIQSQTQVSESARHQNGSSHNLRALLAKHTEGKLVILGEPRVNVLELNLELDERFPTNKRAMAPIDFGRHVYRLWRSVLVRRSQGAQALCLAHKWQDLRAWHRSEIIFDACSACRLCASTLPASAPPRRVYLPPSGAGSRQGLWLLPR
jgi:K+-transporting ATPase, c chain